MKNHPLKSLFNLSLSIVCLLFSLSCGDSGNETLQFQGNKGNTLPVGVSAHDFLSANLYDKLVVEIQYISGYAPSQETVHNLKDMLDARLNKPGGITITATEISSSGQSTYKAADLIAIEANNRTQYTEGSTIAAYILFSDGNYASEDPENSVLGIAYRNTSIAIFSQPAPPLLTSTVLNHEFGHILGLVNNGSEMQTDHQHSSHVKHCKAENCLMYFSAQKSQDFTSVLRGNVAPSFGSHCIADLQAMGGK